MRGASVRRTYGLPMSSRRLVPGAASSGRGSGLPAVFGRLQMARMAAPTIGRRRWNSHTDCAMRRRAAHTHERGQAVVTTTTPGAGTRATQRPRGATTAATTRHARLGSGREPVVILRPTRFMRNLNCSATGSTSGPRRVMLDRNASPATTMTFLDSRTPFRFSLSWRSVHRNHTRARVSAAVPQRSCEATPPARAGTQPRGSPGPAPPSRTPHRPCPCGCGRCEPA